MGLNRGDFAPVVLVGLLVIAGCGGEGGDVLGEETITPVPVPTKEASPMDEDSFPPGVARQGVENPFMLANAHTQEVLNRSHTVRGTLTIRYENGTLRGQRRTTARVAANATRFHVMSITRGPRPPFRPAGRDVRRTAGRSAFWSAGNRLFWTVQSGNVTDYHMIPPVEYTHSRWRERVAVVDEQEVYLTFRAVETTVTGRLEGNETVFIRVTATERRKPGSVEESLSIRSAYEYPIDIDRGSVSSVTLSALIGPNGLVRKYRFAYAATVDGEQVRVIRQIRYTAIGATTVGRPDWYGEAVAATNATGTPIRSRRRKWQRTG